MKIKLFILLALAALTIVSCVKNNPVGETYKADGSWKIEKVRITNYDTAGTVARMTELNDVGFMMLLHESEILYEGSYSFTVNSQEFMDSSVMYNLFYNPIKPANTWQVTNYAKAFNLSFSGTVQGFYTFESIASFTVTKLTNQKFGLLYVKTDPGSGVMEMTEEWEMVRATH